MSTRPVAAPAATARPALHPVPRPPCLDVDPDTLFVQGAAQNAVVSICTGCPKRRACLAEALDNRIEFGVWGGMTERERRRLWRRHPEITNWRKALDADQPAPRTATAPA